MRDMSVHAQPMPEGLAPAPGNADTAANTSGRDVARPERGFGQLWEKRFTASLGATRSPEEVMRIWKEHLAELWPAHSSFYAPFRGIEEGEVAGLVWIARIERTECRRCRQRAADRRTQALHAPAFLVDQDERVGAADGIERIAD